MSYAAALRFFKPRRYFDFGEALGATVAIDQGSVAVDSVYVDTPIFEQNGLCVNDYEERTGLKTTTGDSDRIDITSPIEYTGDVSFVFSIKTSVAAPSGNAIYGNLSGDGGGGVLYWRADQGLQFGGLAVGLSLDTNYLIIASRIDGVFKFYYNGAEGGASWSTTNSMQITDFCGVGTQNALVDLIFQDYAEYAFGLTPAQIAYVYDAFITGGHSAEGGITFGNDTGSSADAWSWSLGPNASGGIVHSGGAEFESYTPGNYTGIGGIIHGGSAEVETVGLLRALSSINFTSRSTKIDPYYALDSIVLADKVSHYKELHQLALDNLNLSDKNTLIFAYRITESIVLATRAKNYNLINGIALDVISLVSTAINNPERFHSARDAINLTDLASQFALFIAQDNINLTSLTLQTASYLMRAMSVIALTDQATHGVNIWCVASDKINLIDHAYNQHELRLIAQDTILFIGFTGGEDDQITYVINSLTKGISTYEDFNFNSASGNLLCQSNGIYKREKGLPVSWKLKTGLSNLGSEMQKQVPYVYLGVTNSGTIVLKTVTNLHGVKKEIWYKNIVTKDSTDITRVQLGKGVKSMYWQFEVIGDGVVELESIELIPLELKRRI